MNVMNTESDPISYKTIITQEIWHQTNYNTASYYLVTISNTVTWLCLCCNHLFYDILIIVLLKIITIIINVVVIIINIIIINGETPWFNGYDVWLLWSP